MAGAAVVMADMFTELNHRPIVWRDRNNWLHRCEGSDVHTNVRLIWTRCEAFDVPANASWLQRPEDRVTCPRCLEIMLMEPPP